MRYNYTRTNTLICSKFWPFHLSSNLPLSLSRSDVFCLVLLGVDASVRRESTGLYHLYAHDVRRVSCLFRIWGLLCDQEKEGCFFDVSEAATSLHDNVSSLPVTVNVTISSVTFSHKSVGPPCIYLI